jgi:hypothetical protein
MGHPPRLQGKIVFSDLRKDHHKEALITAHQEGGPTCYS